MLFDHNSSIENKHLKMDFASSKQQRLQTLHCTSKATTAATKIANPTSVNENAKSKAAIQTQAKPGNGMDADLEIES